MPVGKLIKIGVWECGEFIGVVIFGRGANRYIAQPFGLKQTEVCELVRVALTKHRSTVSKIIAISLRILKRKCPGISLVISYADEQGQGHHGGIYQAGNWMYKGLSLPAIKLFYKGRWAHKKTVDDRGINQTHLKRKRVSGKHTYLMPLSKKLVAVIEPMRQPYPKACEAFADDAPGTPVGLRRCKSDPHAPL